MNYYNENKNCGAIIIIIILTHAMIDDAKGHFK
jgi:hypothetical protein